MIYEDQDWLYEQYFAMYSTPDIECIRRNANVRYVPNSSYDRLEKVVEFGAAWSDG